MEFYVKSYKISGLCHPYLMDFFENFTSARYHIDMNALYILASNSKYFRIYGIFLKANWCASYDILNTTFSLITAVSTNLWSWKFTGLCFLTHEIQKWHWNSLKTYWFWAITPIKMYHSVHACKRKRCGTIAE